MRGAETVEITVRSGRVWLAPRGLHEVMIGTRVHGTLRSIVIKFDFIINYHD